MSDVRDGGSPPLTRETHGYEYGIEAIRGITPAYAGNTLKVPS